jgi:hypothetical protein
LTPKAKSKQRQGIKIDRASHLRIMPPTQEMTYPNKDQRAMQSKPRKTLIASVFLKEEVAPAKLIVTFSF